MQSLKIHLQLLSAVFCVFFAFSCSSLLDWALRLPSSLKPKAVVAVSASAQFTSDVSCDPAVEPHAAQADDVNQGCVWDQWLTVVPFLAGDWAFDKGAGEVFFKLKEQSSGGWSL